MKTIKPISPNKVTKAKSSKIPPEVVEAFNELITENWSGRSARVTQDEAVSRIMAKMNIEQKNRYLVFDNSYLDVEPLFEDAGWKVEYDKPGHCETYEAYFVFSKK